MPHGRTNFLSVNPDEPGFIARSKKAVVGGITAGAAALVSSLAPAIADGIFTWPDEFWPVATLTIGGFVLGFGGVWAAPANES